MPALDELPTRTKNWLWSLNAPAKYKGATLEDYPSNDILNDWVANIFAGVNVLAEGAHSGDSLALYGDGPKTQLALAAATSIVLKGKLSTFKPKLSLIHRPAKFMSFSDLVALKGKAIGGDESADAMFESLRGENKEDSYNVRILILDNVGAEYATGSGWARHIFMEILTARLYKGLPVVVTTSVMPSAWRDVYGHTVGDLYDEFFVPIKLGNTFLKGVTQE